MSHDPKFILISAPSGSGKSSVISKLMERGIPLMFSCSATTRKPRSGEIHGQDYYFISEENFRLKIAQDEMLEYEEVYPGRFYGTPTSEVSRIGEQGKHVLFELDAVGGSKLKQQFADKTLAIFIEPPSIDELRRRLEYRSSETPEEIDTRVAKAEEELAYRQKFDLVVKNDQLDLCVETVYSAIVDFLA